MNNPRPSLFGKGSQVFEAAVRETLTGRLISKSLLNSCFSLQSSLLEFSPDGRSYLLVGGGTIVLRDVSNARDQTNPNDE